jgi:hypothetical protein
MGSKMLWEVGHNNQYAPTPSVADSSHNKMVIDFSSTMKADLPAAQP